MVPKATLSGSLVSKVIAVDADSGQNAWLSYQIVKSTDPGLFSIGLHSGEIKTQRDISESDNMKQNLVISVKDNGQPSLSTTCAVNLLISDNLSEVPELKDMTYEDNNSKLTSYLIIALVSVSTFFLTFIILIVAVKFCHRRKPRLLFDGAVAVPSAYLPPNYAEVDGAGTLRSSYNYDSYLTTGSRTSDFKFVSSYNENTLPAGGTLKKEHNIQFGSSMITLDVTGNEDEDNGQPSLSTTCAVHLLISDNLSEVPELKDMTYEDNNSKLTSYLIIGLVCVSTFFLTFIILIMAVKFCHRRKPRLLFDGAVAVPSAYLPPNYAEVDGAGTLRSSYNYDAYLTTGSRTSDFKFVSSYNENTLPAGGTLKKEHNIQFGSSMITLDVTGNEDELF
ncbi:protocadherin beta-7-like protein [Labeo rohita]|uniref:Protocadherin beta-7-like protein n=1 Tax=Labeo rohita TaxID=84645 RepID=A0A498NZ59_LABRO|nr:protocadherin beta-7-like protein [Labeo rohita]